MITVTVYNIFFYVLATEMTLFCLMEIMGSLKSGDHSFSIEMRTIQYGNQHDGDLENKLINAFSRPA